MNAMLACEDKVVGRHEEVAGKYLTFELNGEEFGIRVLKVREVMGIQAITAVPQTDRSMRGVINLRGKIIPVVDLRLKLGMAEAKYSSRTCIIVVQIDAGPTSGQMGIIVDGVSEVLTLSSTDIEPTPDFGQGTPAYLTGMAKVKGKVKILLDLDEVLGTGCETAPVHGLNPGENG